MTIEQNTRENKERQRLEGLWWAVVLIWAGLVFGAGILGLLGGLYRMSSPDAPNPTTWDWTWGGIFLILGLGGFTALNISWPLILVLVGGVILVKALGQRD